MKKLVIFLAEGFEEIEAVTIIDILRRANLTCDLCTLNDEYVVGAHGIQIKGEVKIDNVCVDGYDGVILPGGGTGAKNLENSDKVISLLKEFNEKNKIVSAICAAPYVLFKAGILKNKNATAYPGFLEECEEVNYVIESVVVDGNIVTSRGPSTAPDFAFKLLDVLGFESLSSEIRNGMLFEKN